MFHLIAEGGRPRQSLKATLEVGKSYRLGRSADADLSAPWDVLISRRHALLTPHDDHIEVQRLPDATNPVFFDGKEADSFDVRVGDHFVIGGTAFYIAKAPRDPATGSAQPVEELTFDRKELQKVRFRDADKRFDVLTHLHEVIWGARTEEELYHRLVNLMLAGVSHAEAVAVVSFNKPGGMKVLHWARRRETAGEFRPSGRLVEDALTKRKCTVLHVWDAHSSQRQEYTYTAMAESDWAYCTPVMGGSGTAWGLYVAGRMDRPFHDGSTSGHDGVHLQADVKFTELVGEIISSVQRLNSLERQRSSYRQFLSPTILSALGDDFGSDLLNPRECDVTVLFCDLRGFSLRAEESRGDLLGLLERVSRALGVMTHHILLHGGVTGDFQGDAALGFWGWPFASDEAPLDACRAALGIRAAFAQNAEKKNHPLANFEMGIGIAHGRAVAGKIGTSEQVKLTVFGPVVNLASRLESMTKQLRVPIVLDAAVVEKVRHKLRPDEGRIRRLGKVMPYGMETSVMVSELLPPAAEYPQLSDDHVKQYEQGVDHFIAGRWEEAYRCFHDIPPSDRAQDFLNLRIAQHNRVAPHDWDGIVHLPSK